MTSAVRAHCTVGSKKTVGSDIDSDNDIPVVYVDLPDDGSDSNSQRNHQLFENTSSVLQNTGTSTSNSVNAVDISNVENGVTNQDSHSSSYSNVVEQGSSTTRPGYVNSTIFFDQFRDKRIDQGIQSNAPARPAPALPILRLEPPVDDGFNLSPLELSLPAPPPYSEIDRDPAPAQPQRYVTTQPVNSNNINNTFIPPPQIEDGAPRRKVLTCQHCGLRVHTVVLKQAGLVTHLVALFFLLFCIIPLTLLIYCTDFMKYDNHYCQFCNKLIGYEFPCLCQKLVYVEAEPVNSRLS